jgi:hypothetical protein
MFAVMVLLWTGGAKSGTLMVPEHAAVLACASRCCSGRDE